MRKIKLVARMLYRRPGRLLVLCYIVYMLGALLFATGGLVADRLLPRIALPADSGQAVGMTLTEDGVPGRGVWGSFLTENGDPQLVLYPLGEEGATLPVRQVLLRAHFTRGPGEMELFYLRKVPQGEAPGFHARQRVIGVPQHDGSYLYTLPPGKVAALRLDMGGYGENLVELEAVVLNPHLPLADYYVPDLRGILAGVFLPALASCLIYTIMEVVWLARRRMQQRAADG